MYQYMMVDAVTTVLRIHERPFYYDGKLVRGRRLLKRVSWPHIDSVILVVMMKETNKTHDFYPICI